MFINIVDLLKKKVYEVNFEGTMDLKEFFDGSETIEILKPIKVYGEIKRVGEILELTAKIETEIGFACSRCLLNSAMELKFDVLEKMTNIKTVDKDDELIFIEGDVIDITDIIVNNIMFNMPFKKLCSDNCKGLCQKCGVNLNSSTCSCENDDIDPRLAKLKDVFFN